jgi:MFS family permease
VPEPGRPPVRTNLLQLLAYAALSASALVIPLVAREQGASLAFIGLIGTAHGIAGVASNFIFGRMGDRMDRRDLLAVGFAVSAVAYLLQFFTRDPTQLLVARFLVGFTAGIIPATLVAYVYDKRRPLGKFSSYNAFGWLVGSSLIVLAGALDAYVFRLHALEAVRAFLARVGPFDLLFLASALFSLVGFLAARSLPSMHVRIDVPRFPARVIAANAPVYLSVFLRHFGATAIWAIYPLYVLALGGSLALVWWLHVVNMVAQILVFRHAERSARLGRPRVLILVGLATSASVFVLFTLVDEALHLLPLQLLVGLSFAALWLGCLKEVLARNVERATASGLLNASMSLSNVTGPLVGGLVAGAFGFRATMYVGATVTVLALVLYGFLERPKAAPSPRPLPGAPRPAGEVHP